MTAIRPALFVFSLFVVGFGLLLLSGFGLYFLDLDADPTLIFGLLLIEFGLLSWWFIRSRFRLAGDPFELLGWLLVVVGVWVYFVYPAWPTLIPPTHSADAANHTAYANIIYSTGVLFKDYPAGPALIIATLAHWIGWLPLRLLHLTGATWIALTAGGIYGLACATLPARREYKTAALFAVFTLFVPWGYFGGMLLGSSYFLTQAAAQLFVVAFIWFLAQYLESLHRVWLAGMALCLIVISVSWQPWIVLPLAIFGWTMLGEWRRGGAPRVRAYSAVLIVVGRASAFWIALAVTSPELLPTLGRLFFQGAILDPTLEALGGLFLLVPALGVILIARRTYRDRLVLPFLAFALLQSVALIGAHFVMGLSTYWMSKSFFLLILPLSLCAGFAFAYAIDQAQGLLRRPVFASLYALLGVFIVTGASVLFIYPPPVFAPLSESDIQVALWAKQHLDILHVQFASRKSLVASWLAVGLWGERYSRDLLIDLAALGPKTFDEWRNDPDWGEYLFIPGHQRLPFDSTLSIVYQYGNSAIVQKPVTPAEAGETAPPAQAFGDTLALVSYAPPRQTFQPGGVISFTAQVETLRLPAARVIWRLQLRDQRNNAIAEAKVEPFDNKFPMQRWPDRHVMLQSFTLKLPPTVSPGLYGLTLGLYYVTGGEALPFHAVDGSSDDVSHLARIKVPLAPPDLDSITRTDVRLGECCTLIGYRLPPRLQVRPGDSFDVTLYWQSLAKVSQDYTVFVHLLDARGALSAQQDSMPRAGTYPTSIWAPEEIVSDTYNLTLAPDAAPGEYQLEIGMYQWPSLQRLPVRGDSRMAQGEHIRLPVVVSVN